MSQLHLKVSKQNAVELTKECAGLLLIRGLSGYVSFLFQMASVFLMPLAISSVIFFIQPIIASWMSFIILKERLGTLDIVSLVSSTFGMIILIKPDLIMGSRFAKHQSEQQDKEYPFYMLGAVCAIIAAVASGIAYVTMRKLGPFKLHMSFNALYFGLVSCPLAFISMAIMNESQLASMTWNEGAWLLGLGIAGWMAQEFLGLAFRTQPIFISHFYFSYNYNKPVGRAAVMNYLQLVIAFVVDFYMFNVRIYWTDFLGSALIVTFTLLNSIIKCL